MLVIYNDFYAAICTVLITFMLVNVVDEETIAVMFDLIANLGSMVCNEGCMFFTASAHPNGRNVRHTM